MVLEVILKPLAETFSNQYSFWTLAIIVGFIVFVIMKLLNIPKVYAGVTAIMVTALGLEYGLEWAFQNFGITADFGYYVLKIPAYGEIIMRDGVMLLQLLDFIFNFGIFRNIGLTYLNALPADQITTMVLPAWFKIFVAIYVSMDSILGYFFMVALFGAFISFLSRHLNINASSVGMYTYSLAGIPILIYNYYISNPFYEYRVALPQLQKVLYLTTSGDITSLLAFYGSLALSIVLVMQIIAMAYHYVLEVGGSTVRPNWQATAWTTNAQGIGFTYTMAFAVMYSLHSFEWYIFFPGLILYLIFKSISDSVITSQKKYDERAELQGMIRDTIQHPNEPTGTYQHQGGSTNWTVIGVALGLAVLVGWQMGLF